MSWQPPQTVVRTGDDRARPVYVTTRDERISAGNPFPVTIGDSASRDAFGRLRTSSPASQFAAFNEYRVNPFNWVTSTSGTGTATHSTTTKFTTLSTGGTAGGARAVQQSRAYLRYIPGKSLSAAMTFVMGGKPGANCAKRVGYFDDGNGIFLQYTSAGAAFVRRSSVSGSVVDSSVSQSDWNIDPMDGSGPSGITLDLSNGQILWIDLQFLGMGRVRCGFDIDGTDYVCHEFLHANRTSDQPYIATAHLPIRFEIVNTGVADKSESFGAFCAKVDSEGGSEIAGIQYNASNGATGKSTSTTLIPLLSIRPGPTFNGITNRGWITPENVEFFTTGTVDHYYQVIWNATLTGASWTSINASAMGEYDITASAVSLGNGVVIDSGYISSGGPSKVGSSLRNVFSDRPLVNSFDGTTPDTLTLAIRSISGSGVGYGSVSWRGYW